MRILLLALLLASALAQQRTAECGASITFDSLALRTESRHFSEGHGPAVGAELVLEVPVGATHCVVTWAGPTPPFAAITAGYDGGPANSGAAFSTYHTATDVTEVAVGVTHVSAVSPGLSPTCGAAIVADAAARAAVGTVVVAGSVSWAVAPVNGSVLEPLFWLPTGSASLSYRPSSTPTYISVSGAGCRVAFFIAAETHGVFTWYVALWPLLAVSLGGVLVGLSWRYPSALRLGGSRPGTATGLLLLGLWLGPVAGGVGLGVQLALWQPFAPSAVPPWTVVFSAAVLLGGVGLMVAALWPRDVRPVLAPTALRLVEHALVLAVCAALWFRGFFIIGVVSLGVSFVSNLWLSAVFARFAARLLGDADRIGGILFGLAWLPLTIPIAPLPTLYAAIAVSEETLHPTADGSRETSGATAYALFDVLLSAHSLAAVSLPSVAIAAVAAFLHPPLLLLLWAVALCAASTAALTVARIAEVAPAGGRWCSLCGDINVDDRAQRLPSPTRLPTPPRPGHATGRAPSYDTYSTPYDVPPALEALQEYEREMEGPAGPPQQAELRGREHFVLSQLRTIHGHSL